MTEEFMWLIGTSLALLIAAAGVIIKANSNIHSKISKGDGILHDKIEAIRNNYVREDHMKEQLSHIDKRLDEIKADSRTRHTELIERISSLSK